MFLVVGTPTTARAPEQHTEDSWTREKIETLITIKSKEYGIDRKVLYDTMECETAGTFDPDIQSMHTYSEVQVQRHPEWNVSIGQQEESFGLAQIHLPSHPQITKEEATNPVYATNFMAKVLSEGKGTSTFTCYRILYGQ